MTRILIADNHTLFAQGLRSLVEQQPDVIEKGLQVADMPTPAFATSVALQVEADYGYSMTIVPGSQVAIAPDVFALPMHQGNDRTRLFYRPCSEGQLKLFLVLYGEIVHRRFIEF